MEEEKFGLFTGPFWNRIYGRKVFFVKRSLIVLPYSFELSHCEHTIVDKVRAFNPSHNSKMSLFKLLRNQMSLSSQTK